MVDAFAGIGTVSLAAQWLSRAAAAERQPPALEPDQAPGFDVSAPKLSLSSSTRTDALLCCKRRPILLPQPLVFSSR